MATAYPMSGAQESYLRDLLDQRECGSDLRALAEERLADGTMTRDLASDLITALRVAPRRATKTVEGLTVGMYRTSDGTFYRVHESRESGRLYAKRMVWDLTEPKPRFEYDRGAVFDLTADDRLSLEDARAWGVETGVCCVCGAFLTDAKSVARGIGPICERRI